MLAQSRVSCESASAAARWDYCPRWSTACLLAEGRGQRAGQCSFRQAVVTVGGLAVSASGSLSPLRQRRRLLYGPREERDA